MAECINCWSDHRVVKEITLLKVDNILNATRSQMVDTSGDSYPVSIIASCLSSNWPVGSSCRHLIGCHSHHSPPLCLWSGHVCYIICHDTHDVMLMPSNCSQPLTRLCHNQMGTRTRSVSRDFSQRTAIPLVELKVVMYHKLIL